ncbi:MAG: DNA mismatch repair protein MutL, partial [Chloroflexota bacterium]|nr:DNA mismatch repair protein MutL [Chloroflexota bacterium]
LQPFGGSSFLARALPSAPGAAQSVAGFARELAEDAAEEGDDWLDHVRISLACRSAIRRGQPLAEAEQRALLADLRACQASAVCPHGSPLVVRHSHAALTRLFEW